MQNSKIKKKIITLIGPTACNKTSTAVHLIKKFPISIIGVDSVQIYKRFNSNIVGLDIKPELPKNSDIIINNDFNTSIEKLSDKLIDSLKKKLK